MRLRVLFCLFFTVAVAADAIAQCRIEGVVRRADGTLVSGAQVSLLPQNLDTVTDAAGRYQFEGIRAGTLVRVAVYLDGQLMADRLLNVTSSVEKVDVDFPGPKAAPRGRSSPAGRPPATVPAGDKGASTPEPVVTGSGKGWSGGVRGFVRSADGLSVPGASVAVEGTEIFAMTDTDGRYTLVGLRSEARIVLVASAPGFDNATVTVVARQGAPVEANFVLPIAAFSEDVTVTAEVPMLRASGGTSQVTLRPEQVTSLPSLGEKDIFRTLQLLPGVTGSQEASSGLYVRGGTPDQNLVTLDAFTLYHVDHLFGYFSAFNMEAVDKVEFSKSAFSAADGGRLSGVLRLTGKSKAASAATGFLTLSMLSAGGYFSVPLGTRGSFLIAARRSFQSPLYNNILGLFNTGGPRDGPPGGRGASFGGGTFESTPSSWFYDLNSKLDLKVTERGRFSVSAYDGRDVLDNSRDLQIGNFGFGMFPGQQTETPDLPSDLTMQLSDLQHWKNRGFGATWIHQWAPASSTSLSAGFSKYGNVRNHASRLTSASTGEDYSISSGRGGNGAQAESNDLRDLTFRLDTVVAAGSGHTLSFGGEATRMEVAYNAQTEAVQGIGPGGGFNSGLVNLLNQSGSGRLLTAYAQDTWSPTARIVLTPGLRVSKYDLTNSTFVEPRLRLNYQATPRLQFKAGYGVHHQVASRITNENLSQGDREFWTLSNGTTVPVEGSVQLVGGASYETGGFLIDVEAYHKTLDNLTMFAPRLTPGVTPGEGASYLHFGKGAASGLEMLFQKKFGMHTGWVSYTLSRIEQTFPTLESNSFPASQDQTHEFKLADSVQLGNRWTAGGSWIFGSGRPYTPAVGIETVELPIRDPSDGSSLTVNRLTFGPKNSDRLPTYHRLDLSIQGEFELFGAKTTLGVTIFNVYDRQNVWYRSYQTFGGSGTANDVLLMGRAVNVFFKVGF